MRKFHRRRRWSEMQSFNRVILIGRLVADPEIRATATGKNVVRFRIAVNRRMGSSGNSSSNTDFIDVFSFRENIVNFVSTYLGKGRLVLVEGELRINRWQASDGTYRQRCEVSAFRVDPLDKKSTEDAGFVENTEFIEEDLQAEDTTAESEDIDLNEEFYGEDVEKNDEDSFIEDEDEPPF